MGGRWCVLALWKCRLFEQFINCLHRVLQFLPMNIPKILKNETAFKKLAEGAHPSAFFAANKMTFSDHFEALQKSKKYQIKFYQAITASLAAWHKVADEAMLTTGKNASSYHKNSAGMMMEKFESKLWLERVKDMERFIPEIQNIESQVEQQNYVDHFTISFDEPVDRDEKIKEDEEFLKNASEVSSSVS